MNKIKKLVSNFDRLQRSHPALSFPYAVVKKYGEDQAGYQAALLTYYGFLSLFPLLLVLTTVVDLTASSHPAIQHTVIKSITNYFPMLGSQLSAHVNTIHKSGVALITGVLFTLYGARGVADAFRNGVSHLWLIPVHKRDGFPKSVLKSLSLILVGGVGFILASLISGYAAAVGRGIEFRALSLLLNVFILFWLFTFLLNIGLPRHVTVRETKAGAASAAIGLVILQSVGSYLLRRELQSLDALYSIFAIALGLLFWLYLQAQVFYYSVEIASVSALKLWPRAVDSSNLTEVDRRVYGRRAAEEQLVPQERISVDFTKPE